MTEAPEAPQPRRIPAEAWVGVVIVAVCLGAYFGPKLYHEMKIRRLARALYAEQTNPEAISINLSKLMEVRQRSANAAIAEFAAQAPNRVWMPEERLFLWLDGREVRSVKDRGEEQFWVRAQLPSCILIEHLAYENGRLLVTFKLSDELSTYLRVEKGKMRDARLSAPVAAHEAWNGLTHSAETFNYVRGWQFAGGTVLVASAEQLHAEEWLRLAGEQPPGMKTPGPPGPAAPVRDENGH